MVNNGVDYEWVPPQELPRVDTAAAVSHLEDDTAECDSSDGRPGALLAADAVSVWVSMLGCVTMSRTDVTAVAHWALDRADAANELSALLATALTAPDASPPRAVARLYVAADILANAGGGGARGASQFRSALGDRMPRVFEVLGGALRSAPGRLSRAALHERVHRVLSAWSHANLFPELFLAGLECSFTSDVEFIKESGETADGGANADGDSVEAATLEARCVRSGLDTAGGAAAMRARLAALDKLLRLRFECGAVGDGIASGKGDAAGEGVGGGGEESGMEAPQFMVALPPAPPPPTFNAVHSILTAAVADVDTPVPDDATQSGSGDGKKSAVWTDVDAAPLPVRAAVPVASKVVAPIKKIGLKLAASVAPKPRAVAGFSADDED